MTKILNFSAETQFGIKNRDSDPLAFDTDPDPAFSAEYDPDSDSIRIQGFDDQKL
jgi:hypothetical protein